MSRYTQPVNISPDKTGGRLTEEVNMNKADQAIQVRLSVMRAELFGQSTKMEVTPSVIKVTGWYAKAAAAGDVYPVEVPVFKTGKGYGTPAEQYEEWHQSLGSFLVSYGHRTLPTRVEWRKPRGGGYILVSKLRTDRLFAKYGMDISKSDLEYMNLYREKSAALLGRESKVWSYRSQVKVGIVFADKSHDLLMDGPLWLSINSETVATWNSNRAELGLSPAVVGDIIQVSGVHNGSGFSALKGACQIVDDEFVINHLFQMKADGAQTFGYELMPISELREMVWATDMSAKRSADVFKRSANDQAVFTYSFGVHTWGPDRVKFGGTLGAQMMERVFGHNDAFSHRLGYVAGDKVRSIVDATVAHANGDDSLLVAELSSKMDLDTLATSEDSASLVRASQVLSITGQLDLAYGTADKLQEAVAAAMKVALKFRVSTNQAFRAYAVSEYMYRTMGGMELEADQVAIGAAWYDIEGEVFTDDNGIDYKVAVVKRSPILSHRAILKVRLIVGHSDLKGVVLPMSDQGTGVSYLAARGMACDFDGDMLDVFTNKGIISAVDVNTADDWALLASYASVSLKYLLATSWKTGWADGHSEMIKEFFLGRIISDEAFDVNALTFTSDVSRAKSYHEFMVVLGNALLGEGFKMHKLGSVIFKKFGVSMVRKDYTMKDNSSVLYRAIRCENIGTEVGKMDNIVHALAIANMPAGILELHRVQGIISAVKHAGNGGIGSETWKAGDDMKFLKVFKKQAPVDFDDVDFNHIRSPYWIGVLEGYGDTTAYDPSIALSNIVHVDAAGCVTPNKVKIIGRRVAAAMPFFGFFGGGEFLSLFGEKVGSAKMKLVTEATLFGSALHGSRTYIKEMAALRNKKSAIWDGNSKHKRTESDAVQFEMNDAKARKNASIAHAHGRVDHLISWFTRSKKMNLTADQAVDLFFSESDLMHVRNRSTYADMYKGRVSLWYKARHTAKIISAVQAILDLDSVDAFENMVADIIFLTVHATGKGSTLLWLIDSSDYLKRLAGDTKYIPRRENVRWSSVKEWQDWFISFTS